METVVHRGTLATSAFRGYNGRMIELIQGDCLEEMKKIPENSVDAIVTDPPYGLEFMGKHWDKGVPGVHFWQEMMRVLKPGGYVLTFGGTRTYHRMACAIEDAGFEVRDMIEWVYGSGFPKSLNIGKAVDKLQGNERVKTGSRKVTDSDIGQKSGWNELNTQRGDYVYTKGTSEYEGWGTALKPAHEPICMARKPLAEKTVAENCLKWGTGGINIDESRVGTDIITNNINDFSNQHGNKFGNGMPIKKLGESQVVGRFPANLIHDNSEEVRECFPETKSPKSYTRSTDVTDSPINWNPKKSGTEQLGHGDSGNASRFFKSIIYQAKASKSERNKGCEGLEEKEKRTLGNFGDQSDFDCPDGANREGEKGVSMNKNNHPTVKPIALMEYLINMVSKEGATILDPFMGSGTTGVACKNLNRNFIGIELDKEYFEIAKKRIGI